MWLGTPWAPNSQALGFGVACHLLPCALYVACGAMPGSFPKIVGDPAQSRHTSRSVMCEMLDECPLFSRLDLDAEAPLPGDLLGLRIHRCVDHLGVCLGEKFVHVLVHKHTCFDDVKVPPWSQRIEAAWRIIE